MSWQDPATRGTPRTNGLPDTPDARSKPFRAAVRLKNAPDRNECLQTDGS
jgi:hypothetical protein